MKKIWIFIIIALCLEVATVADIRNNIEGRDIEKGQTISCDSDPWLEVVSPNGGELWSNIQVIIWDWGGEVPILPVYFNLYYKKMDESWLLIIMDYETENNTFLWDTQNVNNGQYLIKVELWLDTDLDGYGDSLYLNDASDNWFTIDNYDPSDDVPPTVWITKPGIALYINDKEIMPFFTPLIIGHIQIWPHAYDNESGLKLLELYINDEIKANFTDVPKSWTWDEKCFGKYSIKLIAFDNYNNNASCEITVWKFF